ncbi:hypothetical protein DYB25_004092 [Aphanomyces astaci]|uniref:UBC core domain-containing protein n=1 Tax=Aphanomyces astaci TaxID=112090 RepID=A0A397BF37_APHAT|nr:hypothetical protein DYB25_004092 [Aphanomyces astaci]
MTTAAASAYKTAFRHYTQYLKAPIPGVSISQLEANKFHVNTKVLQGPYEGIVVHWELTIPESYPHTPPFGQMASGYAFNSNHHHHVFDGSGICCDVLGNFNYMHESASGFSGWTPAANFTTLMIYLQPFFADPDGMIASGDTIKRLRVMDEEYVCNECGHSTKSPLPPLDQQCDDSNSTTPEHERESTKLTPEQARAQREIACPVMGLSIIDDPTMCMGYPLRLRQARTLEVELFPEFLSYTAFEQAKNARGCAMRTSTGHDYTHWLPIFLTPAHFSTHQALHKLSFAIDRNHSVSLVDLLVKTMNKQVLAVMNGSSHESESAIVAYANLLRLLRHVLSMHPNLQTELDSSVRRFITSPNRRTKTHVPDLGEFYVKLCVSTVASLDDLTVRETVVRETFARQIRWIRQADPACVDDVGMPMLQRLQRLFDGSVVSNRITTFVMEMAKVFGTPAFCSNMDRHFGLPPSSVIVGFQERVKTIKAKLVNYDVLVRGWGLQTVIASPEAMLEILMDAKAQSARAGYDVKPRRQH